MGFSSLARFQLSGIAFGRCLKCGRGERPGDPLLPFGTEPSGQAWVHGACWPAWHRARKAEANAALRAMGIHADENIAMAGDRIR
jgi:hypothetical protein